MTDLGVLAAGNTVAYGINNRGQVVGAGHPDNGNGYAFLWQNGVMSDLGTLGYFGTEAYGINERGDIIGFSPNTSAHDHAFLWRQGVMSDLGTLGGFQLRLRHQQSRTDRGLRLRNGAHVPLAGVIGLRESRLTGNVTARHCAPTGCR